VSRTKDEIDGACVLDFLDDNPRVEDGVGYHLKPFAADAEAEPLDVVVGVDPLGSLLVHEGSVEAYEVSNLAEKLSKECLVGTILFPKIEEGLGQRGIRGFETGFEVEDGLSLFPLPSV
jgi:hypothetical protein